MNVEGLPLTDTVFVVQHTHDLGEGREDVKFIGVYSSKQQAEQAVKRLLKAPGFAETPDGFSIDEYELDMDHWTDGFVTVD